MDLLLPLSPPLEHVRARRLTTFLRLLSRDGQSCSSRSAPITLERARSELQRCLGNAARSALTELLAHYLDAATPAEGFAWFGERRQTAAREWSLLERLREHDESIPPLPEPGEDLFVVARRLLEGLARFGLAADELLLWRIQVARLERGPGEVEPELKALLERDGLAGSVALGARAALAECYLDRGSVHLAAEFLESCFHRESGARGGLRSDRLAWLFAWSRLLRGDRSGAEEIVHGRSPWPGGIPAALVELRERMPGWSSLLPGRFRSSRTAQRFSSESNACSRGQFGALVYAVFALRPCGQADPVWLDVAPGLTARCDAWLKERSGELALTADPEHALIHAAGPIIVHREGAQAIRGAIASMALAVALAPVLDREGELAGWIRLEWEHHLTPSLAVLQSVARAWSFEVLPRSSTETLRIGASSSESRREPVPGAFCDLVEEFGIKTKERRWWGFLVEGEQLELVAQGGCGLSCRELGKELPRGLRRAWRSGALVRFDGKEPGFSMHPDAASGIVLPVLARGVVRGLIAIESARRRDLQGEEAERLARLARACGENLRAACFRSWHAERFAADIAADVRIPSVRQRVEEILAAGRSRAHAMLIGPPGSGKQIAARWLHFESSRRDEELWMHACGTEPLEAEERSLFGGGLEPGLLRKSERGTLVLIALHNLPVRLMGRLVEKLRSDSHKAWEERVRIVATRTDSEAHEGRGEISLSRCIQLHVPPLSARREEIPTLVQLLAMRFAETDGLRPPSFADDALALLWRQPWRGNIRELCSSVREVVLLAPGGNVTAGLLGEIAHRFRRKLQARIPTRSASPEVIRSALETTRTRGGKWNKTRAALYLGWDPDTLSSRLKAQDLEGSSEGLPREE